MKNDLEMDLVRQSFAITLVFLLLWSLLWWLKRRGFAGFRTRLKDTGAGHKMELIERLAIGPQHALQLVRVNDRVLLIGLSPGRIQLLSELSAAETISR